MKKTAIFIQMGLLCAIQLPSSILAADVSLGKTKIMIYSPPGYVDICRQWPDVAESTAREVSPDSLVLAAFVLKSDAKDISQLGILGRGRSIIVYTLKSIADKNIKHDFFAAYTKTTKNELDKLMEHGRERFNFDNREKMFTDVDNAKFALKASAVVPLGIFAEGINHICVMNFMKWKIAKGSEPVEQIEVLAGNSVYVKNKLILIRVSSKYNGIDDIIWVKNTSIDYLNNLFKHNE